jgi:hypothetical protein
LTLVYVLLAAALMVLAALLPVRFGNVGVIIVLFLTFFWATSILRQYENVPLWVAITVVALVVVGLILSRQIFG